MNGNRAYRYSVPKRNVLLYPFDKTLFSYCPWFSQLCETLEFFLNAFIEFSEFSSKIFLSLEGFEPATSFEKTPQCQQDTCERQDLQIEPNSRFSDLSDCLNSLNSMKLLPHLGKTHHCPFEFPDLLKTWNLFTRNLMDLSVIQFSNAKPLAQVPLKVYELNVGQIFSKR